MRSGFADHTEYVVGAGLAALGLFLLYTQYNVGYWGIFALGAIFMAKNWTRHARKKRMGEPGEAARRPPGKRGYPGL